jgi:hypothetical protein
MCWPPLRLDRFDHQCVGGKRHGAFVGGYVLALKHPPPQPIGALEAHFSLTFSLGAARARQLE